MIIDTKPDGYGIGSVHDALTEIPRWRDREFTDEQIIAVCAASPEHLQLKAAQWGWNDTEVRDDIYVWAKENIELIDKLL